LYLVDDSPRLVMLDAASLEPQATIVLDVPAIAHPRPAGALVLTELKTGTLVAFDSKSKLEERWRFPLNGDWLAGDPIAEGEQLILSLSDGRVVWLDAKTGAVAKSFDVGQQLSFGPQRWGENLVVGTLDGSLVVVDRAPTVVPEAEPRVDSPP
jgi:hypothetical protein